MRLFRILLCFLALAAAGLAQSVQWLTADSGDPADLQLVFDNCVPEGSPVLPTLADATFSPTGRSEQTSIINFKVTRSVILNYRLRSRTGGSVQIPAFTVKTDQGELRVPAYTTGAVRQAADVNIHARLLPGNSTVWAGEIFPLSYTLDVGRRTFNALGSAPEWDPAPLIIEDWSKPEPAEFTANGEARLNIIYKTRAYAKTPGTVTLGAAQQLVNITTGTVGFGLFQQPRLDQVAVTSNQPKLTVRPLPPAPAGFTGAVGQFRLESKVVPADATVGEPVTWTLELTGTGNWPDITGLPAREVSKDFQVIQPQAKRTPAAGKLFEATLAEDVVLVPTRPGTYPLAPVTFTYFDPKVGEYKTLTTPRATVTVKAPAVSPFNVTPAAEPAPATSAARLPEPPAPPAMPAAIPLDPLKGGDGAPKPFASVFTLTAATLAPAGALLMFWLGLALRRAQLTDPGRARREARARLAATLRSLPAATVRRALLLAWQHDTAVLWDIPHAAPPAASLPDAAWRQLWQEAEAALYGPAENLPADWHARATDALARKKAPGFAAWRTLQPRNLLPFLFLLCLLVTPLPAGPAEDYRAGNYAAAEKGWREAVAKEPTDWAARHNLALALAQQSRWPEAAAHATAAFVQQPGIEANRWNLALAYERAGYTPAPLAPFLHPGPREILAQQASPAAWERRLILASAVGALALGWLLFAAYHGQTRWTRFAACTAFALATVAGAAALLSRSTYGLTAHPQAVIVWRNTTLHSIPTEAETAQQTTALPAGSIAIADHAFLGWKRLAFPNGQTGWVRQEALVPLWQ